MATQRDSQGKFVPAAATAAVPLAGSDGKMVQASPEQAAEFGAFMASRDSKGDLRPARMSHGGDVEILMHDGSVLSSITHPAALIRMERLASPYTTDEFELPWQVSLCTETGYRGSLPGSVVMRREVGVLAALRRLPRPTALGGTHEITFLVTPGLMAGGRSPYEELTAVQCPAFEEVTLNSGARGWLWRCTARRRQSEHGTASDWAALHAFPALDDALLRPSSVAAAYNMIAVPLRRTEAGELLCAVTPRLLSDAAVPCMTALHPETELSPAPVPPEQAGRAVSGAIDYMTGLLTDVNGKLAAERSDRAAGVRAHQSDIDVIGDALISEAVNRGWCAHYDDFLESVNYRLSKPLRCRSTDYDVEVEVTFTVTLQCTAMDEDDVRYVIDSDDVASAAREFLSSGFSSDNWEFGEIAEAG